MLIKDCIIEEDVVFFFIFCIVRYEIIKKCRIIDFIMIECILDS